MRRWLPGVGGEQDPIGLPGDYESGGSGNEIIVLGGGTYTIGGNTGGGASGWTLNLTNGGAASVVVSDSVGATTFPFARQWAGDPIEPAVAALYEVFVAPVNPYFDAFFYVGLGGDAPRTWLNLGTSRSWSLVGPDRQTVEISVAIRRVSDGVVQTSPRFIVTLNMLDLNP